MSIILFDLFVLSINLHGAANEEHFDIKMRFFLHPTIKVMGKRMLLYFHWNEPQIWVTHGMLLCGNEIKPLFFFASSFMRLMH